MSLPPEAALRAASPPGGRAPWDGPAATIGEILQIELPRPRDRITLSENPQYHRYRTAVLDFLYRRQAQVEQAA